MVLGPMGICYLAFRVVAITCCYRRHRYTLGTNHWRHCRRDHAQRAARYSRGAGHNADRRCLGTPKTKIPDAKCRVKHARRRPVRSKGAVFFGQHRRSGLPGSGWQVGDRGPHVRNAAHGGCGSGGYFRAKEQIVWMLNDKMLRLLSERRVCSQGDVVSPASCCRGEPPAA
jgi:hypothetical protein